MSTSHTTTSNTVSNSTSNRTSKQMSSTLLSSSNLYSEDPRAHPCQGSSDIVIGHRQASSTSDGDPSHHTHTSSDEDDRHSAPFKTTPNNLSLSTFTFNFNTVDIHEGATSKFLPTQPLLVFRLLALAFLLGHLVFFGMDNLLTITHYHVWTFFVSVLTLLVAVFASLLHVVYDDEDALRYIEQQQQQQQQPSRHGMSGSVGGDVTSSGDIENQSSNLEHWQQQQLQLGTFRPITKSLIVILNPLYQMTISICLFSLIVYWSFLRRVDSTSNPSAAANSIMFDKIDYSNIIMVAVTPAVFLVDMFMTQTTSFRFRNVPFYFVFHAAYILVYVFKDGHYTFLEDEAIARNQKISRIVGLLVGCVITPFIVLAITKGISIMRSMRSGSSATSMDRQEQENNGDNDDGNEGKKKKKDKKLPNYNTWFNDRTSKIKSNPKHIINITTSSNDDDDDDMDNGAHDVADEKMLARRALVNHSNDNHNNQHIEVSIDDGEEHQVKSNTSNINKLLPTSTDPLGLHEDELMPTDFEVEQLYESRSSTKLPPLPPFKPRSPNMPKNPRSKSLNMKEHMNKRPVSLPLSLGGRGRRQKSHVNEDFLQVDMEMELGFNNLDYEEDLLVDDADYSLDEHSGNTNTNEFPTATTIKDRDSSPPSSHVNVTRNNMGLLKSASERWKRSRSISINTAGNDATPSFSSSSSSFMNARGRTTTVRSFGEGDGDEDSVAAAAVWGSAPNSFKRQTSWQTPKGDQVIIPSAKIEHEYFKMPAVLEAKGMERDVIKLSSPSHQSLNSLSPSFQMHRCESAGAGAGMFARVTSSNSLKNIGLKRSSSANQSKQKVKPAPWKPKQKQRHRDEEEDVDIDEAEEVVEETEVERGSWRMRRNKTITSVSSASTVLSSIQYNSSVSPSQSKSNAEKNEGEGNSADANIRIDFEEEGDTQASL